MPPDNHPSKIAIISFLVLSLELAFIRLIPAEIRAISYFTNLLLFSSFFGLGLGCILSGRRSLKFLFPVGLFCVFGFVFAAQGIVVYETGSSVHYWFQGADAKTLAHMFRLPLLVTALLTFLFATLPFVPLGQILASTMDQFPRLNAYSWDIAGSLLGTVVFGVTSYLGMPPWPWICLIALIWAMVCETSWNNRIAPVMAGLCFLCFFQTAHPWKWSPYYFIQYEASDDNLTVWVNSIFHQEAVNFKSENPAYKQVAHVARKKFDYPYEIYRKYHANSNPGTVLILGAGSGNDVNIALLNGARKITAVEIDPVIASLGKAFNRMKPYDNQAVELVIDDGRHFLKNTDQTYDLVIFGTLDSQTLLSGQANLRLENYIYTAECFRDVNKVLGDGGMVAAYYSVYKWWFWGRIYRTISEAFPGATVSTKFQNNYLFNTVVIGAKNIPEFKSSPEQEEAFSSFLPSTDDWPYIYLAHPTISSVYLYLFAFIIVLILCAFIILRKLHVSDGNYLDFFFLGLGFTLLEAAAIVRLALLFGTTWIVSAVVFSAALLTIFLSNLLVLNVRIRNLAWIWAALILVLLMNYFFPVDFFFNFGFSTRILLTVMFVGTPIMCAGICFSTLFSKQQATGYALGINLVGAMAGGLLEYASMLIGMRAVWLVIIVIYLLAYLASSARNRSAFNPAT